MRISSRAAMAVGLSVVGLAALVGQTRGQQDGGVQKTSSSNPPPRVFPAPLIGTVDIEAVFKGYEEVKASSDTFKAEMMGRQKELMKISDEGKQATEMLAKMTPGSPDYKNFENKVTQLKAQFQAAQEQAQNEFAQKEADLMAGLYNKVQGMVGAVAKHHKLTHVMRVNRDPVSGSEPQSVMNAMSRAVVYSEPSFDITNEVIQYLNYNYRRANSAQSTTPAKTDTQTAPTTATRPSPAAPR
jgi:Skp family chaperone for outer membrane proteins